MSTRGKRAASAMALVTAMAFAESAFAQQAQAGGEVGMALPGAQAGAVAGQSDHDMMVGTLGVGFLGRRSMLVGDEIVGDGAGTRELDAPVIGIRYWVNELLGIDAGVGLNVTSGSASVTGTDFPQESTWAVIVHGGVPLSLASTGHFSFQIVPELNVGFGSYSLEQPMLPGDLNGSGFHLDVGARAGAEIHFGFIDIPQLSLQGNVGVRFATDSVSFDNDATGEDADRSITTFGTTVQDNPWNIFISNVAAIYYF